jgi:hypothetical protein
MALTRFGFIVTGAGLDPEQHRVVLASGRFTMIAIGIAGPEDGPRAARALVAEGVELIELCGGFGPLGAAAVIDAIGGAVPVGAVGYGPEAIAPLARLFA